MYLKKKLKQLFVLLIVLLLVFSCSMDNSSKSNTNINSNEKTSEKNFVLKLVPPGTSMKSSNGQQKTIIVKDYAVTSMDISITFVPTGVEIYSLTWVPTDGPQEIRLNVATEGMYNINVVHHGVDVEDSTNIIEAEENEVFYLGPGFITSVTIIPGFFGVINIETGSNDLSQFMIVRQDVNDVLPDSIFNFDDITADQRDLPVTFTLNNYADIPLQLETEKIVFEDGSHFTLDLSSMPEEILPDEFAEFTIQFTSTDMDNSLKTDRIIIKNNFGKDYIINLSCTSKLAGIEAVTVIGDNLWPCPVKGTADIKVIGGGGGGGAGSNGIAGGGGGGAGEVITINDYELNKISYSMFIGRGGNGGRNGDDSNPGDSGTDGQASWLSDGLTQIALADYGKAGGGAPVGSVGRGGAGGNNDPVLRGENGDSEGQGGNGGDNGNGHGGSGWGRSGANDGRAGGAAPVNSGGGGGGGGAAITDPTKHGGDGGSGGNGYIEIIWEGFVIE